MEKKYYQICLRHSGPEENTFLLWGDNGSGYTRNIEEAGLYTLPNETFNEQVNNGDFYIHKDIIEDMKELIRLPKYGDKEETYAGKNEFFVLPNTGQVRKKIGINKMNFYLEGNRNSFDCYFKNTYIEKYKYIYSKTHYNVKLKKDSINEWFYYQDYCVEAKTRNEAIQKAKDDWDIEDDYIKFKSMVTCQRDRKKVLDKWEKYD